MAEKKTKIDIFSGFLGAGKTTLIKKLIKEAFAGEQIVLIENEFGEIGIDGGFMREAGIQVNELNSGCICCSLVGDFREALKKVVETYHPDRILIEPSGVGKLSDVTRAVEGVAEDLPVILNSFVTVADVNKVKMYMKNFGEFYDDQVSHASCIILSRTGNASEEKVAAAVALLAEKNAEIAFSPGFRWGTSLLPGDTIRMEHLLDQTAITYPWTTVTNMSGEMIKTVLEDVCDNLFNPDPYYQQGGDMVRVGGLQWTCDPTAKMGQRIQNMMLKGQPIDPAKIYKVAGWAPVSEEAKNAGEPIWEVVAQYLRDIKTVKPVTLNLPTLKGAANNPGIA
jgi:G3E family GTPase